MSKDIPREGLGGEAAKEDEGMGRVGVGVVGW